VLRLAPFTEREIRTAVNTTVRLIEPAPMKVPPPASSRLPGSSKERSVAQRFSIPRFTGLERFMVEIRRRPLIARSLRHHRELILNYFRAQKLLSSGVVEGLNNKVKVTMRKSYGFRTFQHLELALYHSLGKLPEPESTHEFF